MKKKILIALFIAVISFVGCDGDSGKNVEYEKKSQFEFESKVAIFEGEDGWIHYFLCESMKGESIPFYYGYDAYNLKHKKLEGYEIEIIDEEGNVSSSVYPSIPYLTLRDDCMEDFDKINVFFETVAPTELLGDQQKEQISLEVLDRDLVVELYNDAIQSQELGEGDYYYFPEADIVQEDMLNGYLWQVGFFIQHGLILKVNIELIYDDGIYLTDIVSGGNGNDEQKAIAEMIDKIEAEIIEKQLYIVDKEMYIDCEVIDCTRLDMLLKQIQESYKLES